MCIKLFTLLVLLVAAANVRGDEKFPELKAGNDVFTNVTVTMVTATDVYFTHNGGMAGVKLKNLDPVLQKHFGYVPSKNKLTELKQTSTPYQGPTVTQVPSNSPTNKPGKSSVNDLFPELVWSTDLPSQLRLAKAEKKPVLVLFDGSDWCPASQQVDDNTLNKDEFIVYAQAHLRLVLVDFPHQLPQNDKLKENNQRLAEQFNIHYIPSFILLNADGQELGGGGVKRLTEGPAAFIARLEKLQNH